MEENRDNTDTSGCSMIFNVNLISSFIATILCLTPLLLFIFPPLLQVADFSRNDIIPFTSLTVLPIVGLIICYSVFVLDNRASTVQYGLSDSLEVGMFTPLVSIIGVGNYLVLVLYYVLSGISEPLFILSLVGLLFMIVQFTSLVTLTKTNSVWQVYKVPHWVLLQKVINQFNQTSHAKKLHCTFIHRVSTSAPVRDIFNDVRFFYKVRINVSKTVCHIHMQDDQAWTMTVLEDEDVADSLSQFLVSTLKVAITKQESKSVDVGLQRDKDSKVFKIIST